jgi:hypothetical protein
MRCSLGLFLLSLAFALARAADPSPAPDGTVNGLLLGLDGKPVAERPVHLVGISRPVAAYNVQDLDGREYDKPFWNTCTDIHGRFHFDFIHANKKMPDYPGSGAFAIVADSSPNDAGAVSTRFIWGSNPFWDHLPDAPEWPKAVIMSGDTLNLVIQLKEGFTLKGQIWDYAHPDKPITGIAFGIYNDLHAETRTGWGADIFERKVTVDREGRFEFNHCYPVRNFSYLDEATPPHPGDMTISWVETKEDGVWKTLDGSLSSPSASFVPKGNGTVVHLQIRATSEALFLYFGKVVDINGQPLADVDVVGHKTNFDGTYRFSISSPTISRGLNFYRKGYEQVLIRPCPAGEYNVTLPSIKK